MPEAPIPQEYRYWAFITYSHKDEAQAKWLHRAIETYGIPAKLVEHRHVTPVGEPAPKRFHPIFRDRDELAASSDLGREIENALRASRYLIVICSPHAAQSRWVNREVETFAELGRSDRILAFIVDGEPNSRDERECFPQALRQMEPLAPDARREGDGRTNAKLKLLAGMLGVSFDELKRRDDQRRIRRLELVVAVALVLVAAFAGLAWYAKQQQAKADLARQGAVAAEATAVAEADARATEVARRATAQAQVEEERRIAVARQLAVQAQMVVDLTDTLLARSVLLAVESVHHHPTLEGDQALRRGLALLPRPVARMVHEGDVGIVAFSPDGRWVVSGSWDDTARVWEAATGQEVARMVHEYRVYAVAFSPDGRWVVSGSLDDTARVWEAATGQEVARMVHEYRVYAVAFSPDGRWVVSASKDGTARVWEAATGQEVARMVHEEWVNAVAFSPDGRCVVSGSSDDTARVWSVRPEDLIAEACARLPRNLTLEEWEEYIGDEPYRKTCPNLPGPEGWEEAPQATPSPAPSPTPSPAPHPLVSPLPAPPPTVAVYPSPTLTEPAYPFISPLPSPFISPLATPD